jgi:mono/diheme cytochrome c family protein
VNRFTVVAQALVIVSALTPTFAADEVPGKSTFTRYCAECHASGFGHPGTQQLGWTRGEKLALLESRKDLSADYVTLIVRNGLLEMPAYRPTEISDATLAQLAQYLVKPAKKR